MVQPALRVHGQLCQPWQRRVHLPTGRCEQQVPTRRRREHRLYRFRKVDRRGRHDTRQFHDDDRHGDHVFGQNRRARQLLRGLVAGRPEAGPHGSVPAVSHQRLCPGLDRRDESVNQGGRCAGLEHDLGHVHVLLPGCRSCERGQPNAISRVSHRLQFHGSVD